MSVVVTAQCVFCKKKKQLGPQSPEGPLCDACGGPMVPVQVENKRTRRGKK